MLIQEHILGENMFTYLPLCRWQMHPVGSIFVMLLVICLCRLLSLTCTATNPVQLKSCGQMSLSHSMQKVHAYRLFNYKSSSAASTIITVSSKWLLDKSKCEKRKPQFIFDSGTEIQYTVLLVFLKNRTLSYPLNR